MFSIESCLSLKIVFHQRVSSINDCFQSKAIFHQRQSSIKVIFHQRLSSIKSLLPLKVIFQRRPYSIKGHLSSRVIFHQWPSTIKRASSIKGHLLLRIVLHQRSVGTDLDKKSERGSYSPIFLIVQILATGFELLLILELGQLPWMGKTYLVNEGFSFLFVERFFLE